MFIEFSSSRKFVGKIKNKENERGSKKYKYINSNSYPD